METYNVHIQGLSNNVHHFQYNLGDAFLRHYGKGILSEGTFKADVTLDKRETFIEATFTITGTAKLECDRSLDLFDYPMEIDRKIIFKFGNEDKEMSDDVMMIHRNTDTLRLGHYLFEFIGLAIPMKKLHPRFKQDEETDEIVYSSDENEKKEEIDPRWEILKKLNKN